MLKLDENHINVIHVQDELTRFNKSVSIIMNEIYINTFKKDKINDSFKIIYSFFGKFLCIEKLYIGKLFGQKKLLELKNC
jgi:hypothetical protein